MSQSDREHYFSEGYVLCRGALDGHWLERMRAAYQRAMERSREASESNRWFSLGSGHCAESPRVNRIERPMVSPRCS